MPSRRYRRHRFLPLWLLALAAPAAAMEVCDLPPRYGLSQSAVAIVRNACDQHWLWFRPFIDRDGRLARQRVTEAENAPLADGQQIAWQRVAGYWRESGNITRLSGTPGAAACSQPPGARYADADCRAFLLDTPWSATFVSWVMVRAGIAGFPASPRHMDYIRAAWRNAAGSPYRMADPATEKPAPGDLLCYVRNQQRSFGYAGLAAALGGRGPVPPQSHCDIVVAANVGGDRTLYLIGGNVLNAVTLRMLELDRSGRLLPWDEGATPRDEDVDACSPASEDDCSFNRHDWSALLKLQAGDATPVPEAVPGAPETPAAPPAASVDGARVQ